jgi:hypothetical protein
MGRGRVKTTRTWGLAAALVAASILLYAVLFAAFRDRAGDIAFYTLLDIAFIPVSALIFTLVINRLLEQRERETLLNKLNMVVGAFFSEVGTELIGALVPFDAGIEDVRPHLLFDGSWTRTDFEAARRAASAHGNDVSLSRGRAEAVCTLLTTRREFMLRLLENQTLLEHERFTDMLWAVFHLTEELEARPDLSSLPDADRRHIELDMARAYGRLLAEWLRYAEHLKTQYPYLYSFAVRTNPFDPDARVELVE